MQLKSIYICEKCSHESLKWVGRCPNCEAWNSFFEEIVEKKKSLISPASHNKPVPILEIKSEFTRFKTNIAEFDRTLGGGLTPGSLTLLSGEPGIGKSTLTLQLADNLSIQGNTVIISGEESLEQISSRAVRLGIKSEKIRLLNEFYLENILEILKNEKPEFVIIDSIQVISSMEINGSAGSINQVRYCTEKIMEIAKTNNITILLIGHVTKDGNLAGPKVLEHLVDTVLHLEGDRYQNFRLLKSVKNRFGSCNEVGVFEMAENGLKSVKNPATNFLDQYNSQNIGSALTVAMEGNRPFLIEVQALAAKTPFGYPKRTANGFDINRLQILIAVVEKLGKINLQEHDIFVNIVGGIKLTEPAADLAVIGGIISSYWQKLLPEKCVLFGEVGLCGEIRKVNHGQKRIKEAQSAGFNKIISHHEAKNMAQFLQNWS